MLMLVIFGLAACGGGGGTAPTPPPPSCTAISAAPSGLAATSVTAGTAIVSWTASAPSGCALTFDVYQDGVRVGAATSASPLKISGLAASTTYEFSIDAADAAGISPQSAPLPVTTSAGGTIFNGVTLTGKC